MSATGADTLWIIDPSMETPEDQGVALIAGLWQGATRLFRPALAPGHGPDSSTGYAMAGAVIMGSAASPHAAHPWLVDLSEWLRPVVRGAHVVPVFGICFGHQLIAHLAGAEVGFLHPDRLKRLGIEEMHQHTASRLMESGLSSVFASHREVVTTVPSGYRSLATRAGVSNDAFEHEHLPVFSVQYHPEAAGDFAARAGLCEADLAPEVRPQGDAILSAFMRICRESSAGR